MRIKTQFIITTVILCIILAVIVIYATIVSRQLENTSRLETLAGNIDLEASELGYLTQDYLIYRESQQLERWQSRFASFSQHVAALKTTQPEMQTLVYSIRANQKRLKEVFGSVVFSLDNKSLNKGSAPDLETIQVSWNRMAVQIQGLVSDASFLSQLLRRQSDQLVRTRARFVYAMVILLGAFLLSGYILIYNRIMKSIAVLHAGTAVIGSGNLDFILKEKRNDEIGDLSRAFNRMTADLKGITASKAELEKEMAERKRAEEELREAERALRQLNENLEQRIIERTALAEARSKQLQGLTVELIEAEERERRRVAQLLHDDLQQILAAARMQLEAVHRKVPDQPMLTNVLQLLSQSIDKSRRLSHELSPPVLYSAGLAAALHWLADQMKSKFGLQVEIEENMNHPPENELLKVFMFHAAQELLFNVVKHSGVKSARLLLSTSAGGIDLTVSDHGRGFNPGILDSAAASAGFGLLSIRERARHIGGSFKAESAPGQGCRFNLSVPLNLAGPGRLQQPAANQKRIPEEIMYDFDQEGIRVLFVDDHIVIRQGLTRLMNGQPNINVVGEAANGVEAIEQVRELRPNVVVMDISMPRMDGVEATTRIKAEWPHVCVIGLSMFEDEQIVRRMREAGAGALVSKAASSSELLKAIYEIAEKDNCTTAVV